MSENNKEPKAAQQDEREAFEAWHRKTFETKHQTGQPTRDMHNGKYADDYVSSIEQERWEMWQAISAVQRPHMHHGESTAKDFNDLIDRLLVAQKCGCLNDRAEARKALQDAFTGAAQQVQAADAGALISILENEQNNLAASRGQCGSFEGARWDALQRVIDYLSGAQVQADAGAVAWLTPGMDLHHENPEGFKDWTPLYTHPAGDSDKRDAGTLTSAEQWLELLHAAEQMACASHVIAGTPDLARLRNAIAAIRAAMSREQSEGGSSK